MVAYVLVATDVQQLWRKEEGGRKEREEREGEGEKGGGNRGKV